ncbi:MAG: T9SS type A sorting domain-containing protein [Taibaiella sp.]|nr:T9SS type A sorting domain-containing protein [Taibaiella sp.]
MKSVLFLLFLLLPFNIFGQSTFAPVGAEWYNDMGYGVFHTYTELDTTINGVPCRKIRQTANELPYWISLGLTVHDLDNIYVYNSPDTVFVYNRYFNRFTPLYVFNVHAGDTIKLPILPLMIGSFVLNSPDSTFLTMVDSVKQVVYDTATLKTVYTHPIQKDSMGYDVGFMYRYGRDTTGAYVEKIGNARGMLMPGCGMCAVLATESIPNIGRLRCYNDTGLSVKMIAGICGNPPAGVETMAQKTLNVYPIPATDILNIEGVPYGAQIKFCLTDLIGKEICSTNTTSLRLTFQPGGIYIARIEIGDGSVFYKRVIVLR